MRIDDRTTRGAERRVPNAKRTGCDLRTRYDRAVALGQGYEAVGDKVEAERFYQQADHYRRLLNSRAARAA